MLFRGNSKCTDLEKLFHLMVTSKYLEESLHIGSHENVVSYLKPGYVAANLLSDRAGPVNLIMHGKPVTFVLMNRFPRSKYSQNKILCSQICM